MNHTKSFCERGIKVAFSDGEVVEVQERTYSRCLVAAAHQRLLGGAQTHRQLTVDEPRTRSLNMEPNTEAMRHAAKEER